MTIPTPGTLTTAASRLLSRLGRRDALDLLDRVISKRAEAIEYAEPLDAGRVWRRWEYACDLDDVVVGRTKGTVVV